MGPFEVIIVDFLRGGGAVCHTPGMPILLFLLWGWGDEAVDRVGEGGSLAVNSMDGGAVGKDEGREGIQQVGMWGGYLLD